ncbi:VOC family protein [Flavisphingomonas formosensis]|uniref:VOC family protein n=1 Tax=Flavisphingomonas formosensis TaxID=861534 RepID=UPI0012FBD5B3|nr:VOC family protein [Sphingomonas formosensis]
MFAHICLGADDPIRAKIFYDGLFMAIGGMPGSEIKDGDRIVYVHDDAMLVVGKPLNGAPSSPGNGGTIGFTMSSPAMVDSWHAAGLAHGGTTCEDPPGLRASSGFYLAYLRDPDGNKLCAVFKPGA